MCLYTSLITSLSEGGVCLFHKKYSPGLLRGRPIFMLKPDTTKLMMLCRLFEEKSILLYDLPDFHKLWKLSGAVSHHNFASQTVCLVALTIK